MSWVAVGVPKFCAPLRKEGRKEGRGFSGWSVSAFELMLFVFFSSEDFWLIFRV